MRFIKTIVLLLVIISVLFMGSLMAPKENTKTSQVTTAAIDVNYENIEQQLSKNSLIRDLPEDSSSVLKFYSVNPDGSRKIEKSYILRKGELVEGDLDDPDLVLFLYYKYLSALNNRNLCSIIKEAVNNGELKMESSLSNANLAWKFKGMMKYKDCVG